jgi:hypothetical protein
LELAFRVAVVAARTWAEEAQGVGINGFRQAVGFEGAAEMQEMIPGGFRSYETARDVAAGVVVDGE